MPSQKKIQIVSSLVEKLKTSPNFILVGFEKIPHPRLEELRKNLGEATFKVVKNSLLAVAASKMKKRDVITGDVLKGNSALLTLPKDWVSALTNFWKFAKGEGTLSFKVGILDDKVYDKDQLIKLSELPPREVLIAKIVGALKSPQTRVVYSMKYNLVRLVRVISTIKS